MAKLHVNMLQQWIAMEKFEKIFGIPMNSIQTREIKMLKDPLTIMQVNMITHLIRPLITN